MYTVQESSFYQSKICNVCHFLYFLHFLFKVPSIDKARNGPQAYLPFPINEVKLLCDCLG
jgi:hypothetical protein